MIAAKLSCLILPRDAMRASGISADGNGASAVTLISKPLSPGINAS